jgi:hypothetical protein
MSTTHVCYFVPIDGDVEEQPNVFAVKKPQKSLTLADVVQVRRAPQRRACCTRAASAPTPLTLPATPCAAGLSAARLVPLPRQGGVRQDLRLV